MRAWLVLLTAGVARGLVPSQSTARPGVGVSVATLDPVTAAPPAPASEEVRLAECPLTKWGERIPDIAAVQKAARAAPAPAFLYELTPPVSSEAEQVAWLRENAESIAAKMSSHGAVVLKGWDLVKTPTGFRAAYEALGLSPCLDPLHAVSARPTVASGVYEAVNKESRANFFIGMHNEFVGTRSPRAAMFVCFKAADEGGEFLLADGRAVFRDVDTDLLEELYDRNIRYSVMELPFFNWIDNLGPLQAPVSQLVRTVVEAAVNAKVDFDVKLQWLQDGSAYDDDKTLQARAPVQPPVLRHPVTNLPTWFCNVHSHSSKLRADRADVYGAERFESGASRINKSDMYFGDDMPLTAQQLAHLDKVTTDNIVYLKMSPGDAVLLDNYQTMHGRNVFKGKRKHAVTWFE